MKDKHATLVIPAADIIGQGVEIHLDGERYLISHDSHFKVSFLALPGGEYPICIDASETLESGHFPNPMVQFKCLKIEKISLYSKS